MAISYWTGGTDGDLSDANNWTGGVPGTGDTGVFNNGSVSVDPSLGALALIGSIEIYPGYTGNIGASGNAWSCKVEDHIKHYGHAELWWESATLNAPDVFIACARNDVVVNLNGDGTYGAVDITVMRGTVTLAGSLGATTRLTVSSISNKAQDSRVTVVSNSNDITTTDQDGGEVTLNAESQTYILRAGNCTTPWGSNGKILNGYFTGGVFRHHSTNGAANVTQVIAGNCVYDLGRGAKTVDHLIRLSGLRLLKSDLHTITADDDFSQAPDNA
jgi:hypothetical protein